MAKIWEPINCQLSQWVRVGGGKEATPSVAITDSQSVQIGSTQSEPQAVGCDGGKRVKGRKRHILVDTWGLLLVVVVTAANIAEREGAKLVLAKSQSHYPRLFKILADAGYDCRVEAIDDRFGDRIRQLNVAQLENLDEAVLDFTSLADSEAWLSHS